MEIQVVLSDQDNAYLIKNMYPLYLHDLSAFSTALPNEHAILEPTPVKTLIEQGEVQHNWWEKPDVLFPFLIVVETRSAGFALVATPPHVPHGVHYVLHEVFLFHPYRGKGIAQQAVIEVFNRFQGQWELHVDPPNLRSQAFCRKTLAAYTGGSFQKQLGPSPQVHSGEAVIFRFNNGNTSLRRADDGLQRPLVPRSRFQPRLTPSVRALC